MIISLPFCLLRNFNPRSPWGERHHVHQIHKKEYTFQSTLPVGGATLLFKHVTRHVSNFNPRSPWGERPG